MHVLKIPIILQSGDVELLNKRFMIMTNIHNVIVRHAQKLIRIVRRDKKYKKLLAKYKQCKKEDKEQRKEFSEQLNKIRESYGLSESGLQSYAKKQQHKYKMHVTSTQVQKEASRVYRGVEKVLFGDGKDLKIKKFSEQHTIGGKSATNGVCLYDKYHDFLPKKTNRIGKINHVLWCDHWFKLNINYSDEYIIESLNHNVSYLEIARLAFNDGWHYYVYIYLDGDAPLKYKTGNSTIGIDPGTSTFAAASETKIFLRELAPNVAKYEKKIQEVQKHIDRSKRQANPQNYNDNGTIKKGKHKWKYSKSCKRALRKLRTLYRKKAAYIKQCHEMLADEVIQDSNAIYVEKINYQGLAKRSKNPAQRSEKTVTVTKKNGEKKVVCKFKKKKRFGHSIGCRSPSSLLTILQRKCKQYELKYYEINTSTFKASQYNHVDNKDIKCKLNDRKKIVDGIEVQRDLYSAFLISCSNKKLERADRTKCIKKFPQFAKLMQEEISRMKNQGISKKECFGF